MLSLGQGLFTERSQIRPSSHAKLRAFGMLTGACQKSVVLRNVPQNVRVDEILPISDRLGCFRPSDRLAGWDLHPLEIADFSRRTE